MDTRKYYEYLTALIIDANEIGGQWDGDMPGMAEDRAHVAADIVGFAEKLQTLLDEMHELT